MKDRVENAIDKVLQEFRNSSKKLTEDVLEKTVTDSIIDDMVDAEE